MKINKTGNISLITAGGRVLLVAAVLGLFAGGTAFSEVIVGIKKGVNLFSQYGFEKEPLRRGTEAGLNGGLYAAWAMTDIFILQPELLLNQKGRSMAASGYEERIFLTYLDLPVLLKVRFINGLIKSSFYAGAYFSLLLGGSYDTNLRVFEPNEYERYDINSDMFNFLDAGVLAGADIGILIAGSHFVFLDIRYSLGIVPVVREERARNNVFTLQLGYGFTL